MSNSTVEDRIHEVVNILYDDIYSTATVTTCTEFLSSNEKTVGSTLSGLRSIIQYETKVEVGIEECLIAFYAAGVIAPMKDNADRLIKNIPINSDRIVADVDYNELNIDRLNLNEWVEYIFGSTSLGEIAIVNKELRSGYVRHRGTSHWEQVGVGSTIEERLKSSRLSHIQGVCCTTDYCNCHKDLIRHIWIKRYPTVPVPEEAGDSFFKLLADIAVESCYDPKFHLDNLEYHELVIPTIDNSQWLDVYNWRSRTRYPLAIDRHHVFKGGVSKDLYCPDVASTYAMNKLMSSWTNDISTLRKFVRSLLVEYNEDMVVLEASLLSTFVIRQVTSSISNWFGHWIRECVDYEKYISGAYVLPIGCRVVHLIGTPTPNEVELIRNKLLSARCHCTIASDIVGGIEFNDIVEELAEYDIPHMDVILSPVNEQDRLILSKVHGSLLEV